MEKGFIKELKDAGFLTMALSLSDEAVAISEIAGASEKRALILGNEDQGISKEILLQCDKNVIIPMKNGVDSLNVAAASAVVFWELSVGKRSED